MNYPVLQSRVRGSKSEQNFEDVLNSTPSNADAASAPTTPSLEEKVPLWTRHTPLVYPPPQRLHEPKLLEI